jgi:LPXTG-motif cell wall-anchored protein
MKRLTLSVAMAAALATASTAGAHAKTEFAKQLQPTITGSVASVNEHSVTVNTDGGENMLFEVDSRSMVPTELPAGTRVRIEFHLMESGKYHAARITPIRGGEMTESEGKMPAEHAGNWGAPSGESEGSSTSGTTYTPEASRTPAAAGTEQHMTERTEPYPAGSETKVESSSGTPSTTTSSSNQSNEEATTGEQELPQTSSSIPLLGILGLMALGAGLLLWLARRRRSA